MDSYASKSSGVNFRFKTKELFQFSKRNQFLLFMEVYFPYKQTEQ